MKKIFKIAIVALAIVATGAATANAAFTRNLTVGATGADVTELQSWLISKGFAIPSISSGAAQPGYFGQQTKAAVAAYQTSVGLPAYGFFGPLTIAKVTGTGSVATPSPFVCPSWMTCTTNPGSTPSTPSTGALAGTDGNIQSVDLLSQYSDEEVGEGETDVKVFGFEVEASNDGDIALKSIKVEIVPDGSNSDHLDDYIDGVTIWQGSTKIGSADVEDFSQASNDNWTKTVTVSNSIVRADETEKFYISVDAANSFDSSDINDDAHTIDVTNIRFEDGSGVVTTEDVTITAQQMDFVSFSESADTEIKFSTDSSSPEAGIVVVDDNNDTDGVDVLIGKIKVEGTSDITVDEIPVTLTVTGATDVDAVTNSVTLTIDGEDYTETVSTSAASATVVFNNLDLTLTAGKTYTFTVSADINNIDAVVFDEGDTLTISLTSTNRDYVDAEDEEGDQVSDSDKTGTVTGDAQQFRTNGIALTLVSTDTDATTGTSANDDVGLFTIKYKVTAIGDTVYLSSLATSAGVTFAVDKGGTATTSVTIVGALVNNTDTTMTSVGNYEIEDGESETFTLSVSVPISAASGSGQYRTALTGVLWDTSDDTSMANTYSSELDSFKTDYKVLN